MTGSLARVTTQLRSSDLVWDGGLHATVYADDAPPLQAGADVGWTPDLLAATAVGTELMTLVLGQAAAQGIEILGYVSEQRLHPANGHPAGIMLAPCVTVRSHAAAEMLESILARAIDTILVRSSVGVITVEPRVSVVPPCGPRW